MLGRRLAKKSGGGPQEARRLGILARRRSRSIGGYRRAIWTPAGILGAKIVFANTKVYLDEA